MMDDESFSWSETQYNQAMCFYLKTISGEENAIETTMTVTTTTINIHIA